MKKNNAIPQSFYYDSKNKIWKDKNFEKPCIPSADTVKYWNEEWERTQGYPEQESALKTLFDKLCPSNEKLDDILIKVCTLNDFYSTNIYKVIDVAKVIQELDIDDRLKSKEPDTKLVDDIVCKVKEKTGRSIYSFASKYCSHHRPDIYPIYDSYVDILLRYYRDDAKSEEFSFKDSDLKCYEQLCKIEEGFKNFYKLGGFDAKQIDKFLWQVGKKCFPKWKKANNEKVN